MTVGERVLKVVMAIGLMVLTQLPTLILSTAFVLKLPFGTVASILLALFQLAIIGFLIWFGQNQGLLSVKPCRLSWKSLGVVGLGVLSLLLVSTLGNLWMQADGLTKSVNQEAAEAMILALPRLNTFLMVVLTAALGEEIIFRGLLPQAFHGRWFWVGDVLGTVFFTLMHTPTNLSSFCLYAGMALVFVVLRRHTNRLEEAVLAHGVNNLIGWLVILMR